MFALVEHAFLETFGRVALPYGSALLAYYESAVYLVAHKVNGCARDLLARFEHGSMHVQPVKAAAPELRKQCGVDINELVFELLYYFVGQNTQIPDQQNVVGHKTLELVAQRAVAFFSVSAEVGARKNLCGNTHLFCAFERIRLAVRGYDLEAFGVDLLTLYRVEHSLHIGAAAAYEVYELFLCQGFDLLLCCNSYEGEVARQTGNRRQIHSGAHFFVRNRGETASAYTIRASSANAAGVESSMTR